MTSNVVRKKRGTRAVRRVSLMFLLHFGVLYTHTHTQTHTPTHIYITHRLISVGSHWRKRITWYKIGRWLSDNIRRPIWYPLSDFISTKKDKETSKRSSRETFNRSRKTKKYFLKKPVTEKLKSWLTIPYKETRRNPPNMQERSMCVRLEKISQFPSKLRFSASRSFFGQSFSLRHYPPIYQPPKGVCLLNIYIQLFQKNFVKRKVKSP